MLTIYSDETGDLRKADEADRYWKEIGLRLWQATKQVQTMGKPKGDYVAS